MTIVYWTYIADCGLLIATARDCAAALVRAMGAAGRHDLTTTLERVSLRQSTWLIPLTATILQTDVGYQHRFCELTIALLQRMSIPPLPSIAMQDSVPMICQSKGALVKKNQGLEEIRSWMQRGEGAAIMMR